MSSHLDSIRLRTSATLERGRLLAVLVDGLSHELGAPVVRIWLRSDRSDSGLELAATGGLGELGGLETPPEAVVRASDAGRAELLSPLPTDGSAGPAHLLLENGLRSLAILPLHCSVEGESEDPESDDLGVLAFWLDCEPDAELRQPEALELFRRSVAIALHNSHRFARVESAARSLEAENRSLHDEVPEPVDCGGIVGRSEAIRRVMEQIDQVAGTDAAVLIEGETGTGKELVARTIHERSRRRNGPMVKINCGAIAAGLVESELFGHEKGAFTGALEKRIGRFELANGGTLFLDEVAELPPETQVKLLRALQEQEFERVGSSRSIRVDVRILAAGNRDLAAEVEAGRFRSDLYYRLQVFPIRIPPLRERGDDASLIAACALPLIARQVGKEIRELTPEARAVLDAHAWPGNVRELLNILQRALIVAPGPMLDAPDLDLPGSESGNGQSRRHETGLRTDESPGLPTLREVEKRHILDVLEHAGWVIEGPRGAAVILDLHPNTLRSRMNRLGLRRPS